MEFLDIAVRNAVTNPGGSTTGSNSTTSHVPIETPIYGYIGIPLVFVLGLVGSLLPPLVNSYYPSYNIMNRLYFRFFTGFAAGIVLGVAFVHSIPDSFVNASQVLVGSDRTSQYAWPGFIAMLGAFIAFAIDSFIAAYLRVSHGMLHSRGEPSQTEETITMSAAEDQESQHVPTEEAANQSRKLLTEMWTVWVGLGFHSLFVGLALGITGSEYSLFSAIVAHQFFEGVALGARVAKSPLKRWQIWSINVAFSITAPVGTAIGLGVRAVILNGDANSTYVYGIVDFVVQALSGGILIYVALVHMIKEEMDHALALPERQPRAALFIGFLLGMGAMSIIGIWA